MYFDENFQQFSRSQAQMKRDRRIDRNFFGEWKKNRRIATFLRFWPCLLEPAFLSIFWNSITFLESWIAKFFFAHKLIIYWSLHKKIPSPWIIFGGAVGSRKVFFCKQVCRFLKIAHFWSQVQPSNPYGITPDPLFTWKLTLFSFWNCFQLLWIISRSNFIEKTPKDT